MSLSKLDDIDKSIIRILQKDPSVTHSQIAKELDRSQPAIGARIKKLSEKGILATQIGVDFSNPEISASLNLVKVEMTTTRPEEVFEMAKVCPYIINTLKISGEYNILMFMACSSLKRLDMILDRHFRNKEHVRRIRMDLITSYSLPFILPVNFNSENFERPDDPCGENSCPHCEVRATVKSKKKAK
jgi:Lrp/AsnC family transcriptional regulator, leucine-responsive regulatory protein